jgi:uncharacterized integral membrane protein
MELKHMGHLWLKIRIWLKVLIAFLLVLYVILFVYNNAQEKVQFWYWFHRQPQTNLLLLVLCTFVAGIVGAILATIGFRTVRQVSDLKTRTRAQRMDRDLADLRSKAAMLQTKSPPPDKPPPSPIETLEDRRQP